MCPGPKHMMCPGESGKKQMFPKGVWDGINCPREFGNNDMMCLGPLRPAFNCPRGCDKVQFNPVSRPPPFMCGESLGTRLVRIWFGS